MSSVAGASDSPSTPIVIEGDDAIQYIKLMGLSEGPLREGLDAGEIAARNTSTFAPTTAAGVRRWQTLVEVCRRELTSSHDWRCKDEQNRPTVESDTHTLAFVGGNKATGLNSQFPQAARKKGPATATSVEQNGTLFPMSDLRVAHVNAEIAISVPPQGNWVLLYHRDEKETRWELSLPSGFNRGQFTGWSVRVIMPPINYENVTRAIPDIGGGDVEFRIA